MATTGDGIWTPDQIDDYNLVADLATMSSTVQDALEKRANTYKGTSVQRNSFTSSAPEGTVWVDTNGEKSVWVKQGNSWKRIWPEAFTREIYNGASVFSSFESGVSLGATGAYATLDVVEGQDVGVVTLNAHFTGVSRPSGTGNTPIATIRSNIRPFGVVAATGLLQPGALTLQVSSTGLISVRWAYAAGAGAIRVMSSYIVEL